MALNKVFARHNYKNKFLQKANYIEFVITISPGGLVYTEVCKSPQLELRFAYFSLKTLDLDQGCMQISE
jgi:hypothetical protein